MTDPNDDPEVLTLDKLNQAALGAMLSVDLKRRPLSIAEEEGASRCPCGGPATLYSVDLIPMYGKMILVCDPCARMLVSRATGR